MIKNIKATNSNGASLQFGHRYRITKGLDLSGVQADVNSVEGVGPGSSYQNTRIRDRYFDLEFQIRKDRKMTEAMLDDIKAMIYTVFNPELNPIRFDFDLSNGKSYHFSAHLESTPIMAPDTRNNNPAYQRVLLHFKATDPFIYASETKLEEVATWESLFEFPLELTDEGVEFGHKSTNLIKNIYNEGSLTTGMLICFKATAAVTNPKLINVITYEEMKLNVILEAGDTLRVDTNDRRKTAILIRDGVEHDYFHVIDITSDFLQLRPGDNLFRYDADDGIDHLEVIVEYGSRYLGV